MVTGVNPCTLHAGRCAASGSGRLTVEKSCQVRFQTRQENDHGPHCGGDRVVFAKSVRRRARLRDSGWSVAQHVAEPASPRKIHTSNQPVTPASWRIRGARPVYVIRLGTVHTTACISPRVHLRGSEPKRATMTTHTQTVSPRYDINRPESFRAGVA